MVLVNDTYSIKDSSITISPNGFAVFKNVKIANSGNIQVYQKFEIPNLPPNLRHKDEILIYRPPKEVKKSVESFAHLTVTDTHPWDNVTTKNFKDYAVGLSSATKFKKNHVITSSICITDSDMIVMLQSDKEPKELSCGYFAEFVYEEGVTEDGEPYDGYMKNLVGNHIAIVERGKCGGSCRLWE